eukprot:6170581-Pleurochrysis_carterae.AAC.1
MGGKVGIWIRKRRNKGGVQCQSETVRKVRMPDIDGGNVRGRQGGQGVRVARSAHSSARRRCDHNAQKAEAETYKRSEQKSHLVNLSRDLAVGYHANDVSLCLRVHRRSSQIGHVGKRAELSRESVICAVWKPARPHIWASSRRGNRGKARGSCTRRGAAGGHASTSAWELRACAS